MITFHFKVELEGVWADDCVIKHFHRPNAWKNYRQLFEELIDNCLVHVEDGHFRNISHSLQQVIFQ